MAKLTINPPADLIPAPAEAVVTDAAGRSITLKKPPILAQFRLVEVLGDSAKNESYRQMVTPLLYVAEIDGEKIPSFTKKSQIDGLIQRLDEHGVVAVMHGLIEHFGETAPGDLEKNSAE